MKLTHCFTLSQFHQTFLTNPSKLYLCKIPTVLTETNISVHGINTSVQSLILIILFMIFVFVLMLYMYSGEYIVFDVTLSVYIHRAGWGVSPGVDIHSE
jgi:hypothetical protein